MRLIVFTAVLLAAFWLASPAPPADAHIVAPKAPPVDTRTDWSDDAMRAALPALKAFCAVPANAGKTVAVEAEGNEYNFRCAP